MTPYYQDDWVTIYHGDCREIVPQLGMFDLLLTDPPYGLGRDGKPRSTSSHGGHKGYPFLGWDKEPVDDALIDVLIGACRDFVVFGANYFCREIFRGSGWLMWDKGQRIDQADGELAASSLNMPLRIFTLNRCALKSDGAEHPTQKPVALMAWCLSFTAVSKTILDPFAGSGTTGRAAKDLGRKCTLIEIEERYCEIAARRMSQEVFDFG